MILILTGDDMDKIIDVDVKNIIRSVNNGTTKLGSIVSQDEWGYRLKEHHIKLAYLIQTLRPKNIILGD